ncbi:hypothetical protein [Streptomyces sp. NPDC048357]|uniref:hypothetical protein n=1 Tax=Streptomyces sp. NPDC048357 TaxID=3154719 RepID=UPI0034468652
MTQPQTQAVRPKVTYTKGDFVLFRDVERFWLGKPGHTFVGRVERSWRHTDTGKVLYDLVELRPTAPVPGSTPTTCGCSRPPTRCTTSTLRR